MATQDCAVCKLIRVYIMVAVPMICLVWLNPDSSNEFLSEVEELKDYFFQRNAFLLANPEINENGIDILNVEYSVGNNSFAQPTSLDEVVISVSIDESASIGEVNLYYGVGLTGLFEKASMNYSFGMGVYNYTIPPQNGGQYVRFYVEVVNGIRTYSPEGAEHDIYVYQVKMDEIIMGDLVINEIMASNDNVATDEYGEYDDWIEAFQMKPIFPLLAFGAQTSICKWTPNNHIHYPIEFRNRIYMIMRGVFSKDKENTCVLTKLNNDLLVKIIEYIVESTYKCPYYHIFKKSPLNTPQVGWGISNP